MPTFIVPADLDRTPQAQSLLDVVSMRGTRWTLALIVSLSTLAFTPAPAAADFHGACTGIATGYADVDLELTGSQDPYETDAFLYSGLISCPDAVITITSLQLFDISGEQPVLLAQTDDGPCEATIGETCSLEGEAPSGPGEYEVRMRFDADDPQTDHIDFENVPRRATFLYTGIAEPVPTCTSTGSQPIYLPPGC